MPSIYQPFTKYEQVEARLIFIYNLGNCMQMKYYGSVPQVFRN